jgi:hypothetical protein
MAINRPRYKCINLDPETYRKIKLLISDSKKAAL